MRSEKEKETKNDKINYDEILSELGFDPNDFEIKDFSKLPKKSNESFYYRFIKE